MSDERPAMTKPNRIASRTIGGRAMGWCLRCDRAFCSPYHKCPVCGYVADPGKAPARDQRNARSDPQQESMP